RGRIFASKHDENASSDYTSWFIWLTRFSLPFPVPSPPPKTLGSRFFLSLIPNLLFEARAAAQALIELTTSPHVRLGVTGLLRAGKTIFITALVDNLIK